MPRNAFEELIERYADGRKTCNCGEAYYDKRGRCESGCSANKIHAKHEVAEQALKELKR